VASDVSPEFTQARLAHMDMVWAYMTTYYGKAPDPVDFFYSPDTNLMVNRVSPLTQYNLPVPLDADPANPSRNVEILWRNPGAGNDMEFARTLGKDASRQQHEFAELFLGGLAVGADTWGWLSEGLALYFDATTFTSSTGYGTTTLRPEVVASFRNVAINRPADFVPLGTLVTLGYQDLVNNPNAAYAGSGVFVLYLIQTYPTLVPNLLTGIRTGAITTQAGVNAYVEAQTGKNFAQLDVDYRTFGLGLQ